MKVCNKCQAEFEQGKFCGKCGGPLVELQVENTTEIKEAQETVNEEVLATETSDVKEETIAVETKDDQPKGEPVEAEANNKKEKKKKEKKKKEKKKEKKKDSKEDQPKKKFKVGKFIGLSLLLIVIGLLGFTGYYLNQSQLDLNAKSDFDQEEFFEELKTQMLFEFEIELPDEGVNYFVEEKYENNLSLPLGLEIGDVIYKNGLFHAQVDNAFIHTTLIITPEVKLNNVMLEIGVSKVELGNMNIPLPHKLFIKEGPVASIQVPKYVTDLNISFNKSNIEADGVIDKKYFKDLIMEGYETFEDGYIQMVMNEYYSDASDIYNYKDILENGSESEQDSAVEDFIVDFINEEQFPEVYLMLTEDETAMTMVDTFIEDTIYIDKEVYDDYMAEAEAISEEVDAAIEDFLADLIKEDILILSDEISDAINDYHVDRDIDMSLLPYDNLVYSVAAGDFITIDSLDYYLPSTLVKQFNPVMYYDGYQIYVLMETEIGYFLTSGNNILGEYKTRSAAMNDYDLKDPGIVRDGSLLHRGDQDRSDIAGAVSDYIYSDNSIFIRYLKSDGKQAFLIASPGDYPQSISEYVLEKINGRWVVENSFSIDSSYADNLYGYYNPVDDDFNVTLLPTYDPNNYYSWYFSYNDQEEVLDHIKGKGLVDYYDEFNYFSRIDEVLVMSLTSGARLIMVYQEGSDSYYDALYTLDAEDKYYDWSFILSDLYYGATPDFVFLQD